MYRWSDGTEYEGSWKEGKFDGVGTFGTPHVGIDYSFYKDGLAVGVGVSWSIDFTQAYHTLDGMRVSKTSLADAEELAKAKFGLKSPGKSSERGIVSSLGQLFRPKRVGDITPDGKIIFKDNGDLGAYSGNVDADGKRQGKGKMMYDCGNQYIGDFLDDKYHGKGLYRWSDGDEYLGEWKDGERHGIGSFKNAADGSIEYSMYEGGSAVGDGIRLMRGRKLAHSLVNGQVQMEMLFEEAEPAVQEKFLGPFNKK